MPCVISESQILTFEAFQKAVENTVIIVLFMLLVKLLENSANSESVMMEFDNMINHFIANMKCYLKKQRASEKTVFNIFHQTTHKTNKKVNSRYTTYRCKVCNYACEKVAASMLEFK